MDAPFLTLAAVTARRDTATFSRTMDRRSAGASRGFAGLARILPSRSVLSLKPGCAVAACLAWVAAGGLWAGEDSLLGHGPLDGHARDVSGNALHAQPHEITWTSRAAVFNGRSNWLEVPAAPALRPGTNDFTLSLWMQLDGVLDDSPGDLLTLFDPAARNGFNPTLLHQSGACRSMANTRNLFFGLDAGSGPRWTDCGRPGHNQMVWTLTVFQGALYAGTWEPAAGAAGHVYRYTGGYDGGARGGVFRYEGGTNWTNWGAPPNVDQTYSFAFHRGAMHTGTWKEGRGFRYLGPNRWVDTGRLGRELEVMGWPCSTANFTEVRCPSRRSIASMTRAGR